ncbi:hypothetical protein BLS_007087 [Venturia inaequalis]|uniref:Uncharacterized protein n=1 Tax=Venturia inaequalis TaxID=5025 RepID=A0A8H3Z1J1_VENIN|nr:hypothetical protein EG328_000701 [Venturia inaequalis]KAE9981691.1 hypothetical protein BLS_007087 [Venturia inaequalis]
MAFTRILLDDNFALGKRRRDDFDDGAVAHSRSLSRIGKPSMTIKTGGFASGLPGTSLPSPPLDHEDHRIFNLVSCQRHDTPPPAKTRRKTVPVKLAESSSSVLTPITIPMRKTDLERYRDCDMCEKRACTKCSVEQGEEFDSFCLECINKEEDHEMDG